MKEETDLFSSVFLERCARKGGITDEDEEGPDFADISVGGTWTHSNQTCRVQEGGWETGERGCQGWDVGLQNDLRKGLKKGAGGLTARCRMCLKGCVNVREKMGCMCGVVWFNNRSTHQGMWVV